MDRNRVKTSLKKRKKRDEEWSLFPYKPYPQQLEFMKDVEKAVGDHGVLVAEACNGFGKTVCALTSILPLNHKIVYATRTHEQVLQVLLELERINKSSGKNFSAVNLASRQHLCLNEKCINLSPAESLDACRLLKEAGECPYKTEFELSSLTVPSLLSTSILRNAGKTRNVCPYFLARKAAEIFNVVVAPYQYIFNEHVRSRVKLALTSKVLVFDEAHNADQVGREALSSTLSERSLNIARQELESVDASTGFIEDLTAYLDQNVSMNTSSESGLKIREDLKQVLKEDLSSFATKYSNYVDEIQTLKMEKGDPPVCFLTGVLNFLKRVDSSLWASYVTVYRRSYQGFNIVEYLCLDPSLAIKPVVEEAYGTLIMSGTFSPLEVFTEILGLEKAKKKSYSAIVNPENVKTIIDPSITTRFTERGEDMIRCYGEKVLKLVCRIPNGVLVFFPQRQLLLDSLNCWKRFGVIEEHGDHSFMKSKPVFVEGAKAEENRKVVEEYKEAAKKGEGAALFGVFRGRNAEGSNFPYEEARGVILIGVPYANYSDPVVKAQIKYYNKKSEGMGERWYVMDAFRAANQAIGRGIRHRDDWCNFLLLDRRYQTYQKLISKWAVANGVQQIII
jgi:Rad3-related DNA helicase